MHAYYFILTIKHIAVCIKYYDSFLVIVQLDAQIPFNIFIYRSLHVSSMSCSSSGEKDCINTASGKCHSVLVTFTRSCIDTICFSWWWAWHAQNMYRTI